MRHSSHKRSIASDIKEAHTANPPAFGGVASRAVERVAGLRDLRGQLSNLAISKRIMLVQRLLVTSLILAVLAIGIHLAALVQFSRNIQAIAHAATLSEPAQAIAEANAESRASHGSTLLYAGYALAAGSAGCVIASARRHEPARQLLTVGLLICYAMLQFLLV